MGGSTKSLKGSRAYCCTTYCCQLCVNFNKGSYLKSKVAYNNMHRRILGYSRRDSVSSMFANNTNDTFDALLRKNIYGLKKRIFNINNDLIRVMYNCFEIVNGPMWIFSIQSHPVCCSLFYLFFYNFTFI